MRELKYITQGLLIAIAFVTIEEILQNQIGHKSWGLWVQFIFGLINGAYCMSSYLSEKQKK